MKRAFTIWGILSLIVWVYALITGDNFSLRYIGATIPMAFLITLFPVMLIEGVLVWRDKIKAKKS